MNKLKSRGIRASSLSTYDFSTSRYHDDLLNTDNNFFDSMVNQIYHLELQLNGLTSRISRLLFGFFDKRDNFGFDIMNFPFLNGDVPR